MGDRGSSSRARKNRRVVSVKVVACRRSTVDSLFLFFFSPPPTFLPSSPCAAMTRHVAAAISLLAGIIFLGTASNAQVSRRLFEARRSAEDGFSPRKGKNRNPPGLNGFAIEIALPHDMDFCTPENGTARAHLLVYNLPPDPYHACLARATYYFEWKCVCAARRPPFFSRPRRRRRSPTATRGRPRPR